MMCYNPLTGQVPPKFYETYVKQIQVLGKPRENRRKIWTDHGKPWKNMENRPFVHVFLLFSWQEIIIENARNEFQAIWHLAVKALLPRKRSDITENQLKSTNID